MAKEASAATAATRRPRACCRAIWDHRADYVYVLPALIVLMIVIAYPVYYTIDLSFFDTPPGLQLRDKIFTGLDNYERDPDQRGVLEGHRQHAGLDHRLDHLLLRPRPRLRARAAPRIHRPRPPARASC